MSEICQKRQRMVNELQAKRKAELEKKKQAIEMEQNKKREIQRCYINIELVFQG